MQPVLASGAVQAGDAALASVQARDANRPRRLRHRVVTVVALGHAAFTLKERRIRARYAVILRGAGAGLAGRVARLAFAVLVVLVGVTVAAVLRRAQTLLVQAPTLDAARAAQCGAGRATGRTRHALPSLLVGGVAGRARRLTCVCDIRINRGPCIDTSYATRYTFTLNVVLQYVTNKRRFYRSSESEQLRKEKNWLVRAVTRYDC